MSANALQEIRERDLSSGKDFEHSLPASPAVVGELVKDRRALVKYVSELRDCLKLAAMEINRHHSIHDRIEDLLRW